MHPIVSAGTLCGAVSDLAFVLIKTIYSLWVKPAQIELRIRLALLTGMQESENGHLMTVARYRFGHRIPAAFSRRDQPVKGALLNRAPHGLVFSNQSLRSRKIFRRPLVQVGADAKTT